MSQVYVRAPCGIQFRLGLFFMENCTTLSVVGGTLSVPLAILASICYTESMLETKEKQKVIEKYKVHPTDSGSPEVQVGIISEEIRKLLLHLKKHAKDFHSKRGLLKMVAKRRTLLAYLKRENEKRYNGLMKKIGLKK